MGNQIKRYEPGAGHHAKVRLIIGKAIGVIT